MFGIAGLLLGCDPQDGMKDTNDGAELGAADDAENSGEAIVPACDIDFAPQLKKLGVPGLAGGVVANGRLACTAVAGMANIRKDRPVVPETVFTWASVSKTVTATAVMVLVDDGLIDLDEDVDEYLYFEVDNPYCAGEPVTVRQLLSHTSSIADGDAYDDSYVDGDYPVALGTFLREYFTPGGEHYAKKQNFDRDCPGEVNEYSNVGTGLLGHIVEEVSGLEFDAFCRARIFDPLGMTDASFHLAALDKAKLAMPYEREGGKDVAYGHFGFATPPDGLLRTSVPHLARFLAMTAEHGVYDGTRILSEESALEMRRVQYPDLDDTQGLGWYYDFTFPWIGHNGGDPGTSSMIFFDPETGVGALLVANGDWYEYDKGGNDPKARKLLKQLMALAR